MHPIISTAVGLFLLSSAQPAGTFVNLPSIEIKEANPTMFTVSMTGYNAVAEQTDGDPTITASGAFSNPDIVAARSVDLADELPFGTVIEILPAAASSPNCGLSVVEPFLGFRVIADSMHSRKRNQIDILFDSDVSMRVGGKRMNPAVTLGKCSNVTIRVVGFVDMKKMPKSQIELMRAVGFATPLSSRN